MRGFTFTSPVDPLNSLDQNDLPPKGWDQLDTSDFRRALFGTSSAVKDCREWEKRELARHTARKNKDK